MFLLNESQITDEKMLVYVNDLLSGDIQGLFAVDEVDAVVNAVTNKVKATGVVPDRKNCWAYFLQQIRKNLHLCLCFSPVGDNFKNRARRFPALVNNTSFDTFQVGPARPCIDSASLPRGAPNLVATTFSFSSRGPRRRCTRSARGFLATLT